MLSRAIQLFALFAFLSCLLLPSYAAVINPVAAQNGNKERICLRSCKFISADASGSKVTVSALETASVSYGWSSEAAATPTAQTTIAAAEVTGAVPANVVIAAGTSPKTSGGLPTMTVPSLGLALGALSGLFLAL